jgi:hypothetical protein
VSDENGKETDGHKAYPMAKIKDTTHESPTKSRGKIELENFDYYDDRGSRWLGSFQGGKIST